MRYRQLSATGDYVLGRGPAEFYVDVPQAPAQAVLTRLRLLTGEWFLNVNEGTPYATDVLGYNTQATRDPAIRTRIVQTQGVKTLLSYSSTFDPATRKFTVHATVDTIYGQATLTQVL